MKGDRRFEMMARREDWSDGISVYARQVTEGVSYSAVKPVLMKEYKPGEVVEPFLRLGIDEGQQLMDELWQCGLRPSEGSGSAGSLRATEKHLSDMRVITMKKLNIEI